MDIIILAASTGSIGEYIVIVFSKIFRKTNLRATPFKAKWLILCEGTLSSLTSNQSRILKRAHAGKYLREPLDFVFKYFSTGSVISH